MINPLLSNPVSQEEEDATNVTPPNNIRGSLLRPSLTIPTKHTVEETYSEDSWRKRILDVVFSRSVELFTAGLILLDVTLAFVDLFLSAEYPSCDIIEKYATSCCPAESLNAMTQTEFQRILGFSSGDNDENLCEKGVENSGYAATCDEDDYPHGVHTAHIVLFSISMVISTIFVIELLLFIIGMGFRQFFGNIFCVVDFIVVMVSILEVFVFSPFNDNLKESLSGFLMLFRMWRFVRIGHGLSSAEETIEAHLGHSHELETQNHELKMLLLKNKIEIPEELDTVAFD